MPAAISVPNTFTNATTADAPAVNGNFTAVVNWINANVLPLDGTKAMTGELSGTGADPTSANQYARKAYVDNIIPVGVISMYGGAAAPTGYMLCQGAAVSRSTYSALFAVIGTTYGVGDGSTTFNLPNFASRGPIGVGTGAGLTARANGATGGEESHVLGVGETPVKSHFHGVNDHAHGQPSHAHSFSGTTTTDGDHAHNALPGFPATTFAPAAGSGIAGTTNTQATSSAGAHGHTYGGTTSPDNQNTLGLTAATNTTSTQDTAASGHNTMQPFLAVNFIIKF